MAIKTRLELGRALTFYELDENFKSARRNAKLYDPNDIYESGEVVLYSGKIYIANTDDITGVFNASNWDEFELSFNASGVTLQTTTDAGNQTDNDIILSTNNSIYFNGLSGSTITGVDTNTLSVESNTIELRYVDGLDIYQGGIKKHTINNLGFGINTATPQFTLDVDGITRVTSLAGTGERVLYATNSGMLDALDGITTTELTYLSGLTQNVQETFDSFDSGDFQYNTGLISGGTISINSGDDTKFDIGPFKGYIVTDSSPTSIEVNYPNGITGITPTYLATNPVTYVAVDENGVVMSDTPFRGEDIRTKIDLGVVVHSNRSNINVVNNLQHILRQPLGQLLDYIYANSSFINIRGNVFSANGNNLKLDKSEGEVYKEHINSLNNQNVPNNLTISSGTELTFRYRLQNSTEYSDTTDIDPDNYDVNGVLTSVPADKYTAQKISIFPSGVVRIQYGQELYDSLEDAVANVNFEDFVTEPNLKQNGLLRAVLCTKEGITNLSDEKFVRFLVADKSGELSETHAPINTYRRRILNSASTGLLSGGTLSINSGNTVQFNVSAGSGVIIDNTTDPLNPTFKQVYWDDITGITVDNIATNPLSYILIDSTGSVIQQVNDITPEQYRTHISLGAIVHTQNIVVEAVAPVVKLTYNEDLNTVDLSNAIGRVNIEGNVFYSPSGLTLSKNAGKTYGLGINYKNSTVNPNIVDSPAMNGLSFIYVYRDGSGGITTTAPTNTIDPTKFDRDGDGSLETVNNNKWTIQRLYFYPSAGNVIITYGQNEYNSINEAKSAIETETFSLPIPENQPIRSYLITRGGANDLTDPTHAVIYNTGKFGDTSVTSAVATGTLQDAYNNSNQPQILTSAAGGALQIKTGTSNIERQFEIVNDSNVPTFSVSGDGQTRVNTLAGSGFRVMYAKDDGILDTLDMITTIELGKLSGLTQNVQQTFNNIFDGTSIVGDSQLLDGLDSSQFIRSDISDEVSGNTTWVDNQSIFFGTNQDMRIWSDGSSFNRVYFDNNIVFRGTALGNSTRFQNTTTGGSIDTTLLLVAGAESRVELYQNNTLRLQTTSTGVDLFTIPNANTDTDKFMVLSGDSVRYRTGAEILSDIDAAPVSGGTYISKITDDLVQATTRWADGEYLAVGDSLDFRIQHNSTQTFVDNATGQLNIRQFDNTQPINLGYWSGTNQERLLRATPNAGVILYYDDVLKFETTSDGARVDGNLLITGDLTVQGSGSTFNVDNLTIEDNVIILNKGESGPGVSNSFSGVKIDRGLTGGTDSYFFGYDEVRSSLVGGFISGETTSEIATLSKFTYIEDSPINGGLTFFSAGNNRLQTTNDIIYDGTSLILVNDLIFSGSNHGIITNSDTINVSADDNANSAGTPLINLKVSGNNVLSVGTDGTILHTLTAAGAGYTGDKILVAGSSNLTQYLTTAELFDDLNAANRSTSLTLTPNNGIIITGGTQDISQDRVWYIGHADTSAFSMTDLTGSTVISYIGVDTFGHVIDMTTRNLVPSDIGAAPATGGTYISKVSDDFVTANTTWDDNQYIGFGFNDDLNLRHTGTLGQIQNETGILRIGNNHYSNVNFYNGGIDVMSIAGNSVGIGTTSPNPLSRLHVVATSTSTVRVSGSGNSFTNANIILEALDDQDIRGLGIFAYSEVNDTEWFYGRPYTNSDSFVVNRLVNPSSVGGETASGVTFFKIDSTGNVGIGATSPTYKLHVRGATDNLFIVRDISTEVRVGIGINNASNALEFGDYSNRRITGVNTIDFTGGRITSTNNNRLILQGDAGVFIYNEGENPGADIYGLEIRHLRDTTSNPSDLVLNVENSSGTTSLFSVDASGNIRVTGAYYDSTNSSGSDSDVLISTATGTSWVNINQIGGVDGSGTTNYIPIWTDSDTIGTSIIYSTGTTVGINTINPQYTLDVNGRIGADRIHLGQSDTNASITFDVDYNTGVGYVPSNQSIRLAHHYTARYFDFRMISDVQIMNAYGSANNRLLIRSGGVTGLEISGNGDTYLGANATNIGIGTDDPKANVDIDGQIIHLGPGGSGTDRAFAIFDSTANTFEFNNSSGDRGIRFTTNSGTIDGSNGSRLYSVAGGIVLEGGSGVANMVLSPTGNIGMGVSTPSQKLHISGNQFIQNGVLYFSNGYGLRDAGGTAQLNIYTTYYDLSFAGNSVFRFENTGYVGHNINNPQATYHQYTDTLAMSGVTGSTWGPNAQYGIHIQPNGDLGADEQGWGITFGNTASNNSEATRSSAGIMTTAHGSYGNHLHFATASDWGTGMVTRMTIKNDGDIVLNDKVTIQNSSYLDILPNNNYGVLVRNSASNGYISMGVPSSTYATIRYNENNNSALYFTATGVGVGTSTPAQELDVNGNIGLNGDLYLNNGQSIRGGGSQAITLDVNNNRIEFGPHSTWETSNFNTGINIVSGYSLTVGDDVFNVDTINNKISAFTAISPSSIYDINLNARVYTSGVTIGGTPLHNLADDIKLAVYGGATFQSQSSLNHLFIKSWEDATDEGNYIAYGSRQLYVGVRDNAVLAGGFEINEPNNGSVDTSYINVKVDQNTSAVFTATGLTFNTDLYVNHHIFDSTSSTGSTNDVLISTPSGIQWSDLNDIAGVDGSGSPNYIPVWTDADTIGSSRLYQDVNGLILEGLTGRPYSRLQIKSPDTGSLVLFELTHGADENNTNVIVYGEGANSAYPTINSISRGSGTTLGINFAIDSTEMMRIATNGNVGIGTTNPLSGFHVNSSITLLEVNPNEYFRFTYGSDYNWIQVGQSLADTDANLRISRFSTSSNINNLDVRADSTTFNGNVAISDNRLQLGATNESYIEHNGSNLITFYQSNWGGDFRFRAADNTGTSHDIFFIEGNSGRIGINTLTPSYTIDSLNDLASIARFGSDSDTAIYLDSGMDGLGTESSYIYFRDNTTAKWFMGKDTGNDFIIYDNTRGVAVVEIIDNGDLYLMQGGGNVGIGTTSPTEKLHVDGNIRVTGTYYDSNNFSGDDSDVLISTSTGTSWVNLNEIGGVDGTGTANYVARWTDTDTIGTGVLYDNGTNVGIGTTTPSAKLDVAGGVRIDGGITFTSGGFLNNNTSAGLELEAVSGDIILTPSSTGNVGIFTTNPSEKLDVNGNIRLRGHLYDSSNSTGSTDEVLISKASGVTWVNLNDISGVDGSGTANRIPIWVDGDTIGDSVIYQNGSNIGIGTTTASLRLSIGASGVGLDLADTSTLGFYTTGSERMRIDSNGNVGIGVSSPVEKLEVGGDIVLDRKIYTSRDGTKGTYLDFNDNSFKFYTSNQEKVSITLSEITMNPNGGGTTDFRIVSDTFSHLFYADVGTEKIGINTSTPQELLHINGGNVLIQNTTSSGNTVFAVDGTFGRLFSITDDLTGSLFSINTIAGLPVVEAFADNTVTLGSYSRKDFYLDGSTGFIGLGTETPSELLDITGNVKINKSLLSNQENLTVDIGTEVIATVSASDYDGVFFDFVVKSGSNMRTGTIYVCHDGTNVEYTETSTNDIGNTDDLEFSVDISGGNIRLLATTTSNGWIVKTLIRAI